MSDITEAVERLKHEVDGASKAIPPNADGFPLITCHTSDISLVLEELKDLNLTFDLRYKADVRAIEMWRKETGKELTIPDQADMCVFLLKELDKRSENINEFVAAAG